MHHFANQLHFAFCEFYTSATASDRLSDATLKNGF